MPNSVTGNGQVPPDSQSPDSNGQVPPVSQASSISGDDSSDSGHSEPSTLSPEQMQDALKKARTDAAKYRVDAKELAELRAYRQAQEDAKLSEKERYDKQIAEYQTQVAELERAKQEVVIRSEVRSVAKDLGLNPTLAYKLLDIADLTFDGSGMPTNMAELLSAAAAEFGLPVNSVTSNPPAMNGNGKTPATRPLPTSVGGTPANPARSATSGAPVGGWSWEAISSLTKDQYEGLTPAQRHAMSQFISSHPKR